MAEQKTFTFTAEQIKDICEIAQEAVHEDFTWHHMGDMFSEVRDKINEGKPEAEQVSRETFFGWFGRNPPDWVK